MKESRREEVDVKEKKSGDVEGEGESYCRKDGTSCVTWGADETHHLLQ